MSLSAADVSILLPAFAAGLRAHCPDTGDEGQHEPAEIRPSQVFHLAANAMSQLTQRAGEPCAVSANITDASAAPPGRVFQRKLLGHEQAAREQVTF